MLLTAFAKLSITKANGLTKVINFSTNISALTIFFINGQVLFPLGLIAGCFNILGNYIGANMFAKKGSRIVKPIIIVVLTMLFLTIMFPFIKEMTGR